MGCVFRHVIGGDMEHSRCRFCNKLIQEVRFWNGSSSVADYREFSLFLRVFVQTNIRD